LREKCFEDVRPAAKEHSVVPQKEVQGFSRYLLVYNEVFVVQHEEDGSRCWLEVFDVSALDAATAFVTGIWNGEDIIIYLTELAGCQNFYENALLLRIEAYLLDLEVHEAA
jgi:hypothetical protein